MEHAKADRRSMARELEIIMALYFEEAGEKEVPVSWQTTNAKPTTASTKAVAYAIQTNNSAITPRVPKLNTKLCKHGNPLGQCFDKGTDRSCKL